MPLRPAATASSIAVATTLLFGSSLGTAAAAVPQDDCKSGAFARYVDPTAGRAFSNQGACVSFVARGGCPADLQVPDGKDEASGALAAGGAHAPDNWQTAHRICNSRKRDLILEVIA